MTKWVYNFGGGTAEGQSSMKNLLGGKGANLAEMASMGLPVPPGFTVTTEVCTHYYAHNKQYPTELASQIQAGIAHIAHISGKGFGDVTNPLLVSVRSGARASMPGMMDTILNLGLNDATVAGLVHKTNNPRFAYDSYRRFIQMYSNVVLDIGHHHFEEILEIYKEQNGLESDTDLAASDWQAVVALYKKLVLKKSNAEFPQDVQVQVQGAMGAVFASWMNNRAKTYRNLHDIPESWGTAVTIQAMVFGNLGETSATGVAFTRNPSTGTRELYGEFLINAQGEDVVAGIRTPQNITEIARIEAGSNKPSMELALPAVYAEFIKTAALLEHHYKDMQDLEFTVETGKLYMLQTRNGKRTTKAALKIAIDMVNEDVISKEEAVLRIDPAALDQLLHPTLDPKATRDVIASGLPASPGAAQGEIVFTSSEAEELKKLGRKCVLVRIETSPEDIGGMIAAEGILTTRGGMTSHAAVVARGMGKPCVSGAGSLKIDMVLGTMTAQGVTYKRGDLITLDGSTGEVMRGIIALVKPEVSQEFATLMTWADGFRRMKIRANAETPLDAKTARDYGAEGIGLCRTEHMFFEGARIIAMREMILADDEAGRKAALAKLLPMQREDFTALFTIMKGLPVTIRLLDPPLHEFLPHKESEMVEVASAMNVPLARLKARAIELHEFNPMLGFRGCRLAIAYPEIAEMQARAIFEAARDTHVEPEIMIPLVASRAEFDFVKARIDAIARELNVDFPYSVGTMIELPRAALQAGKIAETAEFFSFGTNDLTQTTFGISRDDASSFLNPYLAKGLLEQDPFVSLDIEGVGELVQIAVERGRKTRPSLKLGLCGEHGGDPKSIAFCDKVGLDYVSCSPYRVPIARLAAAQSTLRTK
jgi:pyruvate, orthophosphate dikinase